MARQQLDASRVSLAPMCLRHAPYHASRGQGFGSMWKVFLTAKCATAAPLLRHYCANTPASNIFQSQVRQPLGCTAVIGRHSVLLTGEPALLQPVPATHAHRTNPLVAGDRLTLYRPSSSQSCTVRLEVLRISKTASDDRTVTVRLPQVRRTGRRLSSSRTSCRR